MLHTHSPEKENRSPAARKHKQQKELRSLTQLLQFLASNHLTLAPDLQAILAHPPHNEFKLIPSSPREEEKSQLRVQVADLQFELKKVSEDFAEFKLLSKMEKDKTVRKIKEELEEQRSKNSEESIKWQKKFLERSQQYEEECHHFKVLLENSLREEQKQRVHRITQQHNSSLHKLRRELDIAVSQGRKELSSLEETHRSRMEDLTKHYQHEIASLRRNEEVKVKRKEDQMVQKMLVFEKEKKEQIKLIEESRKESSKVQEKYLFQIGLSERERKKFQEKAEDLQMKVKVYAKRLEDQAKAAEQLRREHDEAINRLESEKEEAVGLAEELLSRQKSSFLREQYIRTEQLEQRVQRLAESKEQVENNYEILLRSLEQRFERRESKRQDVEALREFEEKLVSKQRENSHIYHQLRLIRLQKQNDEKLYTKIFSSAKKDKKSLSTRPEHDINTLLRQSRTTDFRQLLKASQK